MNAFKARGSEPLAQSAALLRDEFLCRIAVDSDALPEFVCRAEESARVVGTAGHDERRNAVETERQDVLVPKLLAQLHTLREERHGRPAVACQEGGEPECAKA